MNPSREMLCRSLMYDVTSLSFNFETQTGQLVIAPHGTCNMSGLVALFTAINPDVTRIVTFAGQLPDSAYRLGADGWDSMVVR